MALICIVHSKNAEIADAQVSAGCTSAQGRGLGTIHRFSHLYSAFIKINEDLVHEAPHARSFTNA